MTDRLTRRAAAAYLKAVAILPSVALLRSCGQWAAQDRPGSGGDGGSCGDDDSSVDGAQQPRGHLAGHMAPPVAAPGVRVLSASADESLHPAAPPGAIRSGTAGLTVGRAASATSRSSSAAPPPEFASLVALVPTAMLHRLAWLRGKLELVAGAAVPAERPVCGGASLGPLATAVGMTSALLEAEGRPSSTASRGRAEERGRRTPQSVSSAACLKTITQILGPGAIDGSWRGGKVAALAAEAGTPPREVVAALDSARFAF